LGGAGIKAAGSFEIAALVPVVPVASEAVPALGTVFVVPEIPNSLVIIASPPEHEWCVKN